MTEHDVEEFGEIMTGLAENFGGRLSDPGLDMRFAALSEFAIEQIKSAAMACMRSRKYTNMPTIAEIVEHIEGSTDDRRLEGEKQAREVLFAARQYGVYSNVRFADPVTNAVVRQFIGGWLEVCKTKEDAHKWFIKDFSERYAEYKKAGRQDFEALRGIGTAEAVKVIGAPKQAAIEFNNRAGQGQVKTLVSDMTFKGRQAFRDGAPFHELVEKDGAA